MIMLYFMMTMTRSYQDDTEASMNHYGHSMWCLNNPAVNPGLLWLTRLYSRVSYTITPLFNSHIHHGVAEVKPAGEVINREYQETLNINAFGSGLRYGNHLS